jgi:hypothetical protein
MHRIAVLLLLAACGPSRSPSGPTAGSDLVGHTADGSVVRLTLAGDQIGSVTSPSQSPSPSTSTFFWPPVIDSHVHLAYWPVADRLAATGVLGVVDLASPEAQMGQLAPATGIHVLAAGPMLTHPDGYPLDSWGRDGFGVGCADAACVTATIDRLAAHGARVIKLALDDDGLPPALVPIAVSAAHAHKLRVAAHALTNAGAARAAAAGVDILAHTPVEPLAPSTVEAWRGRAVISTLAAFGGSPEAVANLAALRAAGVTILYGTDLGNSRTAGPSAEEIALLAEAGLDDAAIVAAMTTTPAAYWGLPFGVAPAHEASFLVLPGDPRIAARRLLSPSAVYLRGKRL